MATEKRKPPRAGMGRPKGSPNKTTVEFRETIQKVMDANADNVGLWLSQVAQEDPAKALDLLSKLAEFAAPKLARTELVGDGGGPVQITRIEIVAGGDSKG